MSEYFQGISKAIEGLVSWNIFENSKSKDTEQNRTLLDIILFLVLVSVVALFLIVSIGVDGWLEFLVPK